MHRFVYIMCVNINTVRFIIERFHTLDIWRNNNIYFTFNKDTLIPYRIYKKNSVTFSIHHIIIRKYLSQYMVSSKQLLTPTYNIIQIYRMLISFFSFISTGLSHILRIKKTHWQTAVIFLFRRNQQLLESILSV